MNYLQLALVITLVTLPVASAAQTTELYKCLGDQGETAFQDHPCASKARTEGVIHIPQQEAPASSFQAVTLNFQRIPLSDVIKIIGEVGNVDLQLDPSKDRFINIFMVNVPWNQALQSVMQRYGLTLQVVNGIGYIH